MSERSELTPYIYYLVGLYIFYFCRFTAEEKASRPPMCHMPFGYGPRSCIGMRLALLETRIVLIELFKKYTFVRAPDTEVYTTYDKFFTSYKVRQSLILCTVTKICRI